MVRRFFYLILITFLCNQSAPLQAAISPKDFIEDLGRRAITSLTQPDVSPSELESSFQSLLEEGFDVPGIGQFVMGRYWGRMTSDQQSRFIPLFEKRLIKSYATRFQEYQGVVFTVREARQGKGHVIVTSTIQKPGGPLTPVDWRLEGGKIHDVKVEGVSMSITIRDEYSALVQSNNGNIEQFLAALGGGSETASNE